MAPDASMKEFMNSQKKRPTTRAIKRAEKKCGIADAGRSDPKDDS